MSKASQGNVMPETTRKALREYLNSPEGAAFTLETAKRCAEVKKKTFYTCRNCKVRNEVDIEDSRGSIAALTFMHEYSVGKPERDAEVLDTSKHLEDMTEREREALRVIVYAKLGEFLDDTRELVTRARAGDTEAISACLDLLDPGTKLPWRPALRSSSQRRRSRARV